MMNRLACAALALLLAFSLTGCTSNAHGAPVPETTPDDAQVKADAVNWPKDKLTLNGEGIPQLRVYVVEEETSRAMDIETYVEGVLAGEMKNDWPLEALKAQAILARTFVLKFIQDKESKYPDADISTDIEEAQAYAAADVNDRIRQAVSETSGLILVSEGELPYAWFHAHSGGATDLATVGLGWDEAEPGYTLCTQGNEPQSASDTADAQTLRDAQNWIAEFTMEEVETAFSRLGTDITLTESSELSIAQKGDSGRAITLAADGKEVDAADLRIQLGSTKMRSTLLSTLSIRDGKVRMSGRGYGHGVGMSQWGAYGMAQAGRTAEEIVMHYFRNVTLQKLW